MAAGSCRWLPLLPKNLRRSACQPCRPRPDGQPVGRCRASRDCLVAPPCQIGRARLTSQPCLIAPACQWLTAPPSRRRAPAARLDPATRSRGGSVPRRAVASHGRRNAWLPVTRARHCAPSECVVADHRRGGMFRVTDRLCLSAPLSPRDKSRRGLVPWGRRGLAAEGLPVARNIARPVLHPDGGERRVGMSLDFFRPFLQFLRTTALGSLTTISYFWPLRRNASSPPSRLAATLSLVATWSMDPC